MCKFLRISCVLTSWAGIVQNTFYGKYIEFYRILCTQTNTFGNFRCSRNVSISSCTFLCWFAWYATYTYLNRCCIKHHVINISECKWCSSSCTLCISLHMDLNCVSAYLHTARWVDQEVLSHFCTKFSMHDEIVHFHVAVTWHCLSGGFLYTDRILTFYMD